MATNYDSAIILQLIKLEVGNIDEIIDAMNNVVNKNDINEILDYIIKNKNKCNKDNDNQMIRNNQTWIQDLNIKDH